MRFAIEARGLTKSFGEVKALQGVDLAAEPGTVLGVLGPNGAGKTTAVRILTTLCRPNAGTALVMGRDVMKDPAGVRELIGVTGQYAGLDKDLSGRENLRVIARLMGATRKEARYRAEELLEQFNLVEAAGLPVSGYSGGMRRRLDLAASIVRRPQVLFLDEPTTGLDPASRNDLWATVESLVVQGTTVLLTTQYLEEADRLADRIVVIDHGHVIALGTPRELKKVSGSLILNLEAANVAEVERVRLMVERYSDSVVSVEGLHVLVPVASAEQGQELLTWLRSDGIGLIAFAVEHPTLDEAFLNLTKPKREVAA